MSLACGKMREKPSVSNVHHPGRVYVVGGLDGESGGVCVGRVYVVGGLDGEREGVCV